MNTNIPEEVTLHRIESAVKKYLTKEQLQSARFERFDDLVCDEILFSLHWYTAGRTETLEVPSTWWQHFKLQFFPVWLKKKFPVEWRVYHAYQLFPDIPFEVESTIEYRLEEFGSLTKHE
jgi:hypothetical protein